jgi:hypothetical protein
MQEPDAVARCHDAGRSAWFLKLFFTESTGLRRSDVMATVSGVEQAFVSTQPLDVLRRLVNSRR